MAPIAIEQPEVDDRFELDIKAKTAKEGRQYLKSSGSLDAFKQEDITPVIGTEFPEAKLTDLINAPNTDQLLKDLAIKSKSLKYQLNLPKQISITLNDRRS